MHLRNEGPVKPAPVLEGPAQRVVSALTAWPGMQAVTHWEICDSTAVNGAEFHVDDKELGHIHLDGGVHLLLNRRLSKALIGRKLANVFPYGDEWVELPIRSQADVEHALWLFQVGYDRLRSASEAELLERIEARPALG